MIHDTLSTASVALMNFVLAALGCDEPTPIFGNSGLPARSNASITTSSSR